ncbi:hypothetical protein ACFW04_013840 [Cataglyphis niger]
MSQHLQALESLGQRVENWDSLIIFLCTAKWDIASRNEWEKISVKRGELPNIDNFKTFLNERYSKDKSKTSSLIHLTSNVTKCIFCKGSHNIYSCKDILALPIDKRLAQVKKLKLCRNCLRNNHFKNCKAGGYKKCSRRHNTLLHYGESKEEKESENQLESSAAKEINDKSNTTHESTVAAHAFQVTQRSYILLATARVLIFDSNGKAQQCRALLNNGS